MGQVETVRVAPADTVTPHATEEPVLLTRAKSSQKSRLVGATVVAAEGSAVGGAMGALDGAADGRVLGDALGGGEGSADVGEIVGVVVGGNVTKETVPKLVTAALP